MTDIKFILCIAVYILLDILAIIILIKIKPTHKVLIVMAIGTILSIIVTEVLFKIYGGIYGI